MVLAMIFGLASAICSLIIILSPNNISTREGTTWRKILVYLSYCDLGQALYFVFYKTTAWNSDWCYAFGLFGIFSEEASCFWTACIAHYLYRRIRSMYTLTETKAILIRYHLLSWGYPLITVGVFAWLQWRPDSTHRRPLVPCVGNECFGCYIAKEDFFPGRFLSIYLPQWVCWGMTIVIYYATWRGIRRFTTCREVVSLRRKLCCVPVVFIMLRIPENVARLFEYTLQQGHTKDTASEILAIVQCICNPSQGITNFVLFLLLQKQYGTADPGFVPPRRPLHRRRCCGRFFLPCLDCCKADNFQSAMQHLPPSTLEVDTEIVWTGAGSLGESQYDVSLLDHEYFDSTNGRDSRDSSPQSRGTHLA